MSGKPGTPAATVILVRDGAPGLETLVVTRHEGLDFAGGMAVFPGGRVDDADRHGLDPADELTAARRAAAREAAEEVAVVLDPATLVPYSHWEPPASAPRRYTTWFFVAPAPDAASDVVVDGSEIVDHCWMRPEDALERHARGELELMPPTWLTLWSLARHATVAEVLTAAAAIGADPPKYVSAIIRVEGGVVALYDGDVAYQDHDADPHRTGPRQRLWMTSRPWRFEDQPVD